MTLPNSASEAPGAERRKAGVKRPWSYVKAFAWGAGVTVILELAQLHLDANVPASTWILGAAAILLVVSAVGSMAVVVALIRNWLVGTR